MSVAGNNWMQGFVRVIRTWSQVIAVLEAILRVELSRDRVCFKMEVS